MCVSIEIIIFLIVCDVYKHLPLFSSILTAWYGCLFVDADDPHPLLFRHVNRSSSANFEQINMQMTFR